MQKNHSCLDWAWHECFDAAQHERFFCVTTTVFRFKAPMLTLKHNKHSGVVSKLLPGQEFQEETDSLLDKIKDRMNFGKCFLPVNMGLIRALIG